MATHAFTRNRANHVAIGLLVVLIVSLIAVVTALVYIIRTNKSDDLTGPNSPSIVYLKINFSGNAPYWNDNTKSVTSATFQTSAACTGFFINESGGIATAGHCTDADSFKDDIAQQANNASVQSIIRNLPPTANGFSPPAATTASQVTNFQLNVTVSQTGMVQDSPLAGETPAQVLSGGSFEHADASVLRVAQLKHKTVPLPLASSEPVIGDAVRHIGYPGSVTQENLQGVAAGTPMNNVMMTPKVSYTQVTDERFMNGVVTWMTDGHLQGGMSGGPVVNADDAVVGINSGGGDNMSYFTSLSDLQYRISQSGVMNTVSTNLPDRADADQGIITLALCALLSGYGLLILLVIFRIGRGLRKQKRASATTSTVPAVRGFKIGTIHIIRTNNS